MFTKYFFVLTLIFAFAGFQTTSAQYTGRAVEAEAANVSVIYNNGNFTTGSTTESGVAAPAGFVWSENQHDTGNTTESVSVLGYGATFGAVRLADGFTVPAGQTWNISSVTVSGFILGYTGTQSPFSGGVLQIWNGRPGDPGSAVVFGDLVTDRLLSSTVSNVYTISNTVVPDSTLPPDFSRRLFTNKLSVAPTLTLGPGTYWIDFATSTANNSAQFYRQVVSPNRRTNNGWNARQFVNSSGLWQDVIDGGRPSSAPDVTQDIAFQLNGTLASPRNTAKFMDYDGDGKTDYVVHRWGIAPTSPTDWWILPNNLSAFRTATFGIRVGTGPFSGVLTFDRVLGGDYDGDGKTDVAVWRRGSTANAPQGYYYIQQSSDNQIRIEQFGLTGDVSSIFGDYDGDGKTDLALWRPGAVAGAQSYFYIKNSSNNSYTTIAWGIQGDRPFSGDFDGDGKYDFAVARVNDTESTAYILYANGGVSIRPIAFPFSFLVPGDYDGDGKTDIATIKSVNNNMVWTTQRSSDDFTEVVNCGVYSSDFPAQGDYNGDGKTDYAVYRKTGTGSVNPSYFWIRRADGSFNVFPWGNGLDNAGNSVLAF